MTNTTMKKIILSATTAMFLTACGGGDSTPSAADAAATKIQAYAESNANATPTLQDYQDAGVTGVTATNLDDFNALVDSKGKDDVDTLAELNTLASHIPATNQAPTANAGADVSVEVNKPVTLTGSGTDTDGTIASYKWTKGSTVLASSASLQYTPSVVGTDTLTLTVTDDKGATASDTVTVTVTIAVDSVKPVITLLGDATVTLLVGDTYTDAGATANDNKDGDVTGSIVTTGVGAVDINTANSYEVKYNVSDAATNHAVEVIRTVVVKPLFETVAGGIKDNKTELIWDNAISTACSDPEREPTIEEFQTIIDYTKTGVAVISELTAITAGNYKTSDGWKINLSYGSIENNATGITDTICVEGNSTVPAPSFTAGTGIVTDNNTGLIWQDDAEPQLKTYTEALCSTPWRLPTVVELDSIYDRDTNKTVSEFTNLQYGGFWTSTVGANRSSENWTVNFTTGTDGLAGAIQGAENNNDTHTSYVRCVK